MTKSCLFLRSRWTTAFVLILALAGATSAADQAKKIYQLPAGDAAATLKRFSELSGEQIVYPVDAVRGVQTNALSGELSAREALDRLIAGTELRVVQDASSGALAINRVASPAGTGLVEGRVFNLVNGSYVSNARVTIDALRLETFTDESGQFRIARVPAGEVTVRVNYTGFPLEAKVVKIASGLTVVQDFTLRSSKAPADDTVKLDAFTVAAQRDMAASDVAVNEQRYSAGIKNIVSTDSFADIADGNVGEFAKYLPGVTLNRSGSDGLNISIGGVPPSGTPILLDGNGIASAASSNTERTVEFENIAVGGMSRVEVSRSPTPDAPANAIGGSVNLVSRSAFERSKPLYSFKSYFSFRGGDFSWSKEPGPFQHAVRPLEPNLELSAVVPVTRNFGFSVSGLVARTRNNGPGVVLDWVPTVAAQSANFCHSTSRSTPRLKCPRG